MATSRYLPFGYNKGDEFKSHILNVETGAG